MKTNSTLSTLLDTTLLSTDCATTSENSTENSTENSPERLTPAPVNLNESKPLPSLTQTMGDTLMEMKALQIKALIELYYDHTAPVDCQGTSDLGELNRTLEAMADEMGIGLADARNLMQLGFNSGIKCASSVAISAGAMEQVLGKD